MNIADLLGRQSRLLVLIEAVLMTALIGYLDRITTWEVSLFVFYAVPIFIVTWYGDRRSGVFFAFFCGLVWFLANAGAKMYETPEGYALATLNRVFYFIFVAIGATAMRAQREQTREKLEAMTRARELEQEIVRASEREQMRIGQDLHDGICQNLAAIDCATEMLRHDLNERMPAQAAMASKIQALLKETLVEARGLARGIFPVQMDAEGLPAALEELVELTNHMRRASVTFQSTRDVEIKDPNTGMHLYRIAQEALSNAVRHSGASHIGVRLERTDSTLNLIVEDDGAGMKAENGHSQDGMGLRTMRYRAQLMGASLHVTNSPTGGTSIQCALKLKP